MISKCMRKDNKDQICCTPIRIMSQSQKYSQLFKEYTFGFDTLSKLRLPEHQPAPLIVSPLQSTQLSCTTPIISSTIRQEILSVNHYELACIRRINRDIAMGMIFMFILSCVFAFVWQILFSKWSLSMLLSISSIVFRSLIVMSVIIPMISIKRIFYHYPLQSRNNINLSELGQYIYMLMISTISTLVFGILCVHMTGLLPSLFTWSRMEESDILCVHSYIIRSIFFFIYLSIYQFIPFALFESTMLSFHMHSQHITDLKRITDAFYNYDLLKKRLIYCTIIWMTFELVYFMFKNLFVETILFFPRLLFTRIMIIESIQFDISYLFDIAKLGFIYIVLSYVWTLLWETAIRVFHRQVTLNPNLSSTHSKEILFAIYGLVSRQYLVKYAAWRELDIASRSSNPRSRILIFQDLDAVPTSWQQIKGQACLLLNEFKNDLNELSDFLSNLSKPTPAHHIDSNSTSSLFIKRSAKTVRYMIKDFFIGSEVDSSVQLPIEKENSISTNLPPSILIPKGQDMLHAQESFRSIQSSNSPFSSSILSILNNICKENSFLRKLFHNIMSFYLWKWFTSHIHRITIVLNVLERFTIASLDEDRFGQVQRDVGEIIVTQLELYVRLESIRKQCDYFQRNSKIMNILTLVDLQAAVEHSLTTISKAFQDHNLYQLVNLSPDQRQILNQLLKRQHSM